MIGLVEVEPMAFCSLAVTLLLNHSPSPDLRYVYAAEADEQGVALHGGN